MRILFAAADRDLLRCYAELLTRDGAEVETAFDGTQVYARLNTERYELLILSQTLPRIPTTQLLERCAQAGLPTILLTERAPRLSQLTEPLPAQAYLPLPFLPEELRQTVRSVSEKRCSTRVLTVCGLRTPVADYALAGRRLTAGELDVLLALEDGAALPDERRDGPVVAALNEKLKALGLPQRIRYRNDGYKWVTNDESG